MSASDRNTSNVLGRHGEDTAPGESDRARLGKLRDYLRGLPSLDFTPKGRINVCRRFYCTDDELSAAVAALQSPRPNAPTPELLYTISAAVGHRHHVTGKEAAVC